MSIGIFTDKTTRPKEVDVVAALGRACGNWNSLIEHMQRNHEVREEFKYLYGKKYGWGLQFRFRGKLLLSLYPNKGYFVAQVILSHGDLNMAAGLDLHDNAREAIDTANLYAEGKWLFIRIDGVNDLNDTKELLRIKGNVGVVG